MGFAKELEPNERVTWPFLNASGGDSPGAGQKGIDKCQSLSQTGKLKAQN